MPLFVLHGRIVKQLLVESTVLGLIGGAAGVAVGYASLQGLKVLGADAYSFLQNSMETHESSSISTAIVTA